MREKTVPDNGGVPLEDISREDRVNDIRGGREDPVELPPELSVGDDEDILGINACNAEPPNPVVPIETDQPTGKVLACDDCRVYYANKDGAWEFCPQCASELVTFDEAGGDQ